MFNEPLSVKPHLPTAVKELLRLAVRTAPSYILNWTGEQVATWRAELLMRRNLAVLAKMGKVLCVFGEHCLPSNLNQERALLITEPSMVGLVQA